MPIRSLVPLVVVLFLQGCTERALELANDLAGDMGHPFPTCANVTVSTLAGNGKLGYFDGTGGASGTTEFDFPRGLAVDAAGNVLVADDYNNRLRKISPDGTTTTLAGNGETGFFDGTGGPNGTTRLTSPYGVAVDPSTGAILVTSGSNRIRRVDPGTGATTTLSGNGHFGFADGTGGADGTASFNYPEGLAVDSHGYAYVADSINARIRKIAPDGTTTTLSGNGQHGSVDGTGGPAGTASFIQPVFVAFDVLGNLFVSECEEDCSILFKVNDIRRVAPSGDTTTFLDAGSFLPRWAVQGIAVDPAGWLYVAAGEGVYVVQLDGTASKLAGNDGQGFADGSGCTAGFESASGIALSGRTLFVTDTSGHRIRKIELP